MQSDPTDHPSTISDEAEQAAGAPPRLGTIGVLSDPRDAELARACSADHFGDYALEILAHAGLAGVPLTRADLAGDLPRIVLLPYPLRLAPAEAAALRAHLEAGGAVVAAGGVEGARELFGIAAGRRRLGAALLDWPEGGLKLAAGRLPVWGVQLAKVQDEAHTTALGRISADDGSSGIAATLTRHGPGVAIYLAADIAQSVVRIQQGWPVMGDGAPAPDGTAPIDEGFLKTDDGMALGWEHREQAPEGPAFLTPYADRLRELLLAALLTCAEELGAVLPLAWYWPDGAPAAATLSFDTDSNEGPDGRRFLEVLAELDVRGTWCVMYPGGYPQDLYRALQAGGQEIALHYDALTTDLNGSPHCDWSQESLAHQYEWLKRETGIARAVSQKNHVTRWEGWVQFFRWLERAGILVDQTKGPSKKGNLGFAFGSCHLWRPIEDALHHNRLMDVYELPFLTHDMWHSRERVRLRRALTDACLRHHGAAHFIFHPQRIWEEGAPEALSDIVTYARTQGVAWWTSEELLNWELARRATRVLCRQEPGRLALGLDHAPEGLTLLLPGLSARPRPSEAGAVVDETNFLGRSVFRLRFEGRPPSSLELAY